MNPSRGDQRPPRAARPGRPSNQGSPVPYEDQQQYQQGRPPQGPHAVSFQNVEYGDRHGSIDPNAPRARAMPSAYHHDPEAGEDPSRVGRKKSLVRPDREKIDSHHRQFHYRNHVAQAEEEINVMPSTTGNYPHQQQQQPQRDTLRRGRSLLAREEGDVSESGLNIFHRAQTLRRKKSAAAAAAAPPPPPPPNKNRGCWKGPGPGGPWMTFCLIVTFWMPNFLLSACGIRSPEQQRAWREKMGLVTCILALMGMVGFLTFGFTKSVCGTPKNRFHGGAIGEGYIGNGSVVIHGYNYNFENFRHPRTTSTFNGTTNPLYTGNWNLAGNDASFLFQRTNERCYSHITRADRSSITGTGLNLDWYFPCNIYSQYGTGGANLTGYEDSTNCHRAPDTKAMINQLTLLGQVYYTWEDVKNPARNLAVVESNVLDLNLLQWLSRAQVNYPDLFDRMKTADGTFNGKDLTMYFIRTKQKPIARCLQDIITIGFIDTNTIGCVASEVVLYLSLVFIIGVVAIRFVMAVLFQWFFSWKLGNFPRESYQERMARSAAIEQWSDGIHLAPAQWRPDAAEKGTAFKSNRKTLFPTSSRFTPSDGLKGVGGRPATAYGKLDSRRSTVYAASAKGGKGTPPDSPSRMSRSTMSLVDNVGTRNVFADTNCPFPLHNVVPQPPPDYEPFNFPLAHTICLVTAYSESVEGLRTTLDSIATTDYPNSHKLILVIADGMVKGEGSDDMTPDIVLTMMKEFVIPAEDVEAHSYVAIADGHKRHNMAKVYAGFYHYDENTVERSKQQRVPIVLVAKVGNPLEAKEAKPGNRGKRDSQIVLMSFLQKVMFDERMTTFEYEFFNSIWRVTGVSPDRYELVLCVDADTKVFPDSVTRMISCMVCDEEIMGLCGETKIANKAETFVTMMQVFEYYISHHMTKAFESMFGGVTCLPGCFSMYRIKAPKGDKGYWVPILANPDIVEHYSENVVDTLHKKNLLLLGEDRYLTTLMLKTFPKRKNMFCPQAVCKTIVPDTFRVLLSQRRRWINSTVHNLFELVLVRDLCGTFCFSMQFVVGMELAGTLVLPAAISFTLYLVIDSIVNAAKGAAEQNTIPLILLAIVLGLPGLLIVVTSRKVAYLGWMMVYFVSLPIWNGVLPAYSFWHFDDFSWGQTRKIQGDKGDDHGDKEGEFDSTHIVMKKWAEFERERLWRKGMQSRDSAYTNEKTGHRQSLVSYSDQMPPAFDQSTMDSSSYSNGPARTRHDTNALLMLPAPLSVNRPLMSSTASVGPSRSSEDAYASDTGSGSNQRLINSPQTPDHYSESFESGSTSTGAGGSRHLLSPTPYNDIPRTYGSQTRQRAPSPSMDPNNPFRSMTTSPASNEDYQMQASEEELRRMRSGGGVRLTDVGPVPAGPDGVRRVSRPVARRPTSQAAPATNRYSRSSTTFSLPPGAAPPQPHMGGHS